MRSVQRVLIDVQATLQRADQEAYETKAPSVQAIVQTALAQLLTLLRDDLDHGIVCEGDTCAGCFIGALEAYRPNREESDARGHCERTWQGKRCTMRAHHGGQCAINAE